MSAKTKNIIRIALLFALLLLPIFYALGNAIDIEYSLIKKLAYLVVVVVLLLVPATFLKARTYFIVEGIGNFLFFPIDIASLYLNRQSTSTVFLQNIFNTDRHEASELIVSVWPLCLIVIALWVLYFVLAFRVENKYMMSSILRKVLLISLPILFVVGIIALSISIKLRKSERTFSNIVPDAAGLVWMKLYKIYPYNLYLETTDILLMRQRQRTLQKQVEDFRFGIAPQADESALYVLVIGEAARYDHFSLNGYQRSTTPYLESTEHLISFDSAFSQANLTTYSVPLMLTRAMARDSETAYKERSIVEAFQEAGFRSDMISKQQLHSQFTQRIMNVCDDQYAYTKPIDVAGNYDGEMVDKVREFTRDTAQFMVLHSLGCHFRYEQRYPEQYAVYEPVLGQSFSYSMLSEPNKDKLINAYDNAILYTDAFLHQLICYMDSLDKPAVMVYMSDHGESFWDDEQKLLLHGSYVISKYEYHVPLLVWYSEEYAALHRAKIEAMEQNRTTPLSSDVLFYSLLDLADISSPVIDSTRSICSPQLKAVDTVYVHTGSGDVAPMAIH